MPYTHTFLLACILVLWRRGDRFPAPLFLPWLQRLLQCSVLPVRTGGIVAPVSNPPPLPKLLSLLFRSMPAQIQAYFSQGNAALWPLQSLVLLLARSNYPELPTNCLVNSLKYSLLLHSEHSIKTLKPAKPPRSGYCLYIRIALEGSIGNSSTTLSEDIASALEKVEVFDLTGRAVPISDLWKDRKAVVAFARHFGCVLCRKRADFLASKKEIMDASGVTLVLIGPGSVEQAKAFSKQTGFKGGQLFNIIPGCVEMSMRPLVF
ncbi:hypothetical protein ACLOJK_020813 [Asimina triloba]